MATSAVARWTGHKTKFEIASGSGHTIVADEPPIFGDDEGMRPTELLLGALGACTGVNAVLLLRKFKQPFETLEVKVEGDRAKEWPQQFTEIRVVFEIGWGKEKHDKALVETALDMAVNKYCPVDATLVNGTRVKHSHKDR